MDIIQEDVVLYIGKKPQTIQVCEDRESVYFELGLTASQAEKLSKQGVMVFKFETYLERSKHNFKHYYTIVGIKDLVKILPKR